MAAGSIVVDLLLKTGSFETDTARAGKNLKKLQKDAEDAGRKIGLAFTGAVVGLGFMLKSSIDAADHLNDLSKKTGIAADTLGGIGFAASQSGSDLDSAAAAAGKLNKSLAEAAAGNKEASEAFKALGISVKDAAGNTKLADVALAEISDKFAGYADGPEKAALALRIFGKAGADIIPLLDEGGAALRANIDYFKRYSGVTIETVQAADQFNDTQAKLKLLSGAFSNQLAAEALPLLQTLADRFLAVKEQGTGFKTAAEGIVDVLKGIAIAGAYVVDTFQGVGREIGAVAAQAKILSESAEELRGKQGFFASLLDPFGSGAAPKAAASAGYTSISDAVKADGERAKKDLDAFVKQVMNPFVNDPTNYGNEGRSRTASTKKPPAPRLPATGGAGTDPAAQILKKRLDGELKLIQDFERAQADAYAFGNAYIEGVYQDGIVSLKTFFADQQALREAGLANTLSAIDKEIAAQRAFIANPVSDPKDRVASEEKIKLAVQQRAEVITKASATEILATQANASAIKQLADQYKSLQAQVLSASGDEFGAAQIRNAQQFNEAKKLITQAGGDPAQADRLKESLDNEAAVQEARKQTGAITDRLAISEERIALAQSTGAISELKALEATGVARQQVVAQLEAQLAIQEKLSALKPNDVGLALSVERTRLELDKLKASLDPVKEKFDSLFRDSASGAIADYLNGVTSAKDALRGFGKSILTEINVISSREIAGKLFGKDGLISGSGGLLSGIFGKPKSVGVPDSGLADLFKDKPTIDTSGVSASFANLQTTGIDPTVAAFTRLQAAVDAMGAGFGAAPATTGEQSITALFKDASAAQDESKKSTEAFDKSTVAAGFSLVSLASAASRGGSALSLLPSIVQAFAATSSSSSAGGGWVGAVVGLIGGLFGGGSSATGMGGISGAGGGASGAGMSLAVGMNRVPYDGFKAVLHKGERVVPAAENPFNGGRDSTATALREGIVDQRSEQAASGAPGGPGGPGGAGGQGADVLREHRISNQAVMANAFNGGNTSSTRGGDRTTNLLTSTMQLVGAPHTRDSGSRRSADYYPAASGIDRVPYDGFKTSLHKDERVVPAAFNPAAGGRDPMASPMAGRRSMNININVTMPQGATRDTGMQFGAGIAHQLARANGRNN